MSGHEPIFIQLNNEKDTSKMKTCLLDFYNFIKDILIIYLWWSLIFLSINLSKNAFVELRIFFIASFVISYCLYLILEILSPIFKLIRTQSNKTYDEIISDYKNQKPEIFFKCNNPNIEKKIIYNRIEDISGELNLNVEEKKPYILLQIVPEIYLNDYGNYTAKKKKFIKEINSEDITTITKFENLDNQYFLCLEKKGCFLQMNILYFIIFNLLTFGKIFENIFFENVLTLIN